ncbi:poly-gamma-glutamate hydrolase family protein [Actinomycetes bacterium M1A6_2h]
MEFGLRASADCPADVVRIGDGHGFVSGRQVRVITRTYGPMLMTVVVDSAPTGANCVAVSPTRFARLDSTVAVVDNRCTAGSLTDEEAREQLEMVERIVDDGRRRSLIAIAPHGGDIEPTTDAQAERLVAVLGDGSAWSARAWSPTAAFKRWHVPSTLLNPDSFPVLKPLMDRRFERAVAFHGCSFDGVVIGGTAPSVVKHAVAQAVGAVVTPSGFPVELAGPESRYSGRDPRNLVNRLCAGDDGSLQLEQGLRVRAMLWREIADAVAGAMATFVE